jgi:hypothetical protein
VGEYNQHRDYKPIETGVSEDSKHAGNDEKERESL